MLQQNPVKFGRLPYSGDPFFLFTKENTKHQFNMRHMAMIEKMTVT